MAYNDDNQTKIAKKTLLLLEVWRIFITFAE